MFLGWYKIGMTGKKPNMPATGYTWQTLPELNKNIRKMYTDVDLYTARKMLDESFDKVQELIKNHSDENLFEKKK